jgi:hypothetical protein
MMARWVVPCAIVVALSASGVAVAHPPPQTQNREIVRLTGHRSADAPAPAGRTFLSALGAEHPFAATARDAYRLTPDEATPPTLLYTLQGPRALLARFASARPDQTIAILAEHHPGSDNLFLLALDLCPPE